MPDEHDVIEERVLLERPRPQDVARIARELSNGTAPMEVPEIHETDLGNSKRLVQRFGQELRFCHPWGMYLVWDGKRWKADDTDGVMARAKRVVLTLGREAALIDDDKQRRAVLTFARASESGHRLEAMVKLARSEPGVPVVPAELDRHPWLLNVQNGIVDLRTGDLLEHDRRLLLTRLAPVDFDAGAECPLWLAFLERILPDRLVREYVQRSVGYALTGTVVEQALFFLYGSGANGKSTFLNIVRTLLGDEYATEAAPDFLVERRGERHPTELALLFGRRLVTTIETGTAQYMNEPLVKRLTSSDPITARRMREDFWQFEPTHKLFLAANHKPIVRGTDYGVWRRIKLIPFDVEIGEAERDRNLEDKLRDELPGILAWAVDGCLDWQRQGLVEPTAVVSATGAYRSEMDVLGQFLAARAQLGAGLVVATRALRTGYEHWCEQGGERPLGAREFAAQLRRFGCLPGDRVKRIDGVVQRYWRGLALRDAETTLAMEVEP